MERPQRKVAGMLLLPFVCPSACSDSRTAERFVMKFCIVEFY